jgi:hypothetical protein
VQQHHGHPRDPAKEVQQVDGVRPVEVEVPVAVAGVELDRQPQVDRGVQAVPEQDRIGQS